MFQNLNKIFSNTAKPKYVFCSKQCFPITSFVGQNSLLNCCAPVNICNNIFNLQSRRDITTCRHYSSTFTHDHLVFISRINYTRMYSSFLSVSSQNLGIQKAQKRFKSKKSQKRLEYDSDSDDEEEGNKYEDMSKATKPITLQVQSMRGDGILKKALNITRTKVETAHYEGNIRVNGEKPVKKSFQVKVGDELDFIKGVSPMNPDFLSISRLEIISVKEGSDETEEHLIVKIRRTKTMYIENYESSPWKKSTASE